MTNLFEAEMFIKQARFQIQLKSKNKNNVNVTSHSSSAGARSFKQLATGLGKYEWCIL